MASPFSGLVLGSGAVLASPALWDAWVEGTTSITTAITRLMVTVLVSWIGFSVLESLLAQTAQPDTGRDDVPQLPAGTGPTVRSTVVEHDNAGADSSAHDS
jgi:hypothetical protein